MSEKPNTPDFTKVLFVRKAPNWWKRIGCSAALILWITVLLLPCAFCALLTQGQIIIPLGNLPGQELRIWLIMDADQRGFGVSSASAYTDTESNLSCLNTSVNFLLWQGRGEGSRYCECYRQDSDTMSWVPVNSTACT